MSLGLLRWPEVEICSAWEVTGDLPTAKAMLCTADRNKAKAQRVERLQVRLMRRCNEKCGPLRVRDAQAFIAASYRSVETPCA